MIDRMKGGDESAFRSLYDQYSRGIYHLAFQLLKDEVTAEEVVQETFLKLWENADRLDAKGDIWNYLYVLAKRNCLNRFRNLNRTKVFLEEIRLRQEMDSYIYDHTFDAKELEDLIQKSIQSLPPKQRTVFEMSRFEGLTHQQIADHLQVSPHTVRNHIVQAMVNIKIALRNLNYPINYIIFLIFF